MNTLKSGEGSELKTTQSQWALGLEYKVSETSRLVGRYGNTGVKHADELLKDYDFSTTQTELFMTVDF